MPPRYIPFKIWHNSREIEARYITIHMTNDPYTLSTMGTSTPIFHWLAQVVLCITKEEANSMEQPLLHILHHNYNGRDWVDNAMVCLHNNGLCADVHCFQKLGEELAHKTEEVRQLEDHITDIYLELHPCTQRLCMAKAVEQVQSQWGEAIHLISPWSFE